MDFDILTDRRETPVKTLQSEGQARKNAPSSSSTPLRRYRTESCVGGLTEGRGLVVNNSPPFFGLNSGRQRVRQNRL